MRSAKTEKSIVPDKKNIAFCGLYCGACKSFLSDKCPGCQKNEKASWCKVRKCCFENGIASCAECNVYATASDCKKFNNIFSQLFSFIFGSDRQASLDMIKDQGYAAYAEEMSKRKSQSIKKR